MSHTHADDREPDPSTDLAHLERTLRASIVLMKRSRREILRWKSGIRERWRRPGDVLQNLAEFRFPEFSHVPLYPTRRTLPGLPSRVQRYLRAGLIRYSARIREVCASSARS
jgi:hypothetical protein